MYQTITSGCCHLENICFCRCCANETASKVFIDGLNWVFLPNLPRADVWGGDEGHVVTADCRALKLYYLFIFGDICYLSVFVKVIYDDLRPPPL